MYSVRIALAIAVFTTFAANATWALPGLPGDALEDREPEQAALSARGYYLGRFGVIRRLNQPQALGCLNGFEIQSHRGYPTLPENAFSSVVVAFAAKFNAVEVDARQLRDGTWVLNHDESTQRTMLTRSNKTKLRNMDRSDWTQSTLRNRLGQQVNEQAEDLATIASGAFQAQSPGQTLNIELKDNRGINCQDLGQLNETATLFLSAGQVSYSSMNGVKPLVCMREHNPDAYLALIQGPSRKALEKWAAANHGEELSKLNGNRRLRAAAQMATEAFGSYKYPSWSSTVKLQELRRTLGGKVGLHVEISDLKADPGLVARAQSAGVKLMTYTLTDNDSHLNDLLALKSRGVMPDGAIVDSTPIKTCKMLGLE